MTTDLNLNPPNLSEVSASLSGAKWVMERSNHSQDVVRRQALRLQDTHALPPSICLYLARKGVFSEEVDTFLEPKLKMLLPEPFLFKGMPEAIQRLVQAVEQQEKIGIFGDYDVDGACSAAVFYKVLTYLGCSVEIHIPDRFTEGYGPNIQALQKLKDNNSTLNEQFLAIRYEISSFEKPNALYSLNNLLFSSSKKCPIFSKTVTVSDISFGC